MTSEEEFDLASQTYLSWKQSPPKRRRKRYMKARSMAFQKGNARDPVQLTAVMQELNQSWGWQAEIETAQIIYDWNKLVGEKIASRTSVKSIGDGVITVECASTTWATELRRIRADIITKIMSEYPNSNVREIKFLVTGVPSWNHGFRSVRGKGPRDTYK